MTSISTSSEWQALKRHWDALQAVLMRDLFQQEPNRFQAMSLKSCGILLDFSKNRITGETLRLLTDLARAADVPGWIGRMFAGERINNVVAAVESELDETDFLEIVVQTVGLGVESHPLDSTENV